jgi:tRNA A-37 threonylcarbamoyl transferase component Bud32
MRRRSYLLTENIEGNHAWCEFLDNDVPDREKHTQASKIKNIMEELKWLRVSHGDMKAQNIICTKGGPVLIDLDGLRSNQSVQSFDYQFKKDIKRFAVSWESKVVMETYFNGLLSDLLD